MDKTAEFVEGAQKSEVYPPMAMRFLICLPPERKSNTEYDLIGRCDGIVQVGMRFTRLHIERVKFLNRKVIRPPFQEIYIDVDITVKAIFTYGRYVEKLHHIMSGTITVEGDCDPLLSFPVEAENEMNHLLLIAECLPGMEEGRDKQQS